MVADGDRSMEISDLTAMALGYLRVASELAQSAADRILDHESYEFVGHDLERLGQATDRARVVWEDLGAVLVSPPSGQPSGPHRHHDFG